MARRGRPKHTLQDRVVWAITYRYRTGFPTSTTLEIATVLQKSKSTIKYALKCLLRDGRVRAHVQSSREATRFEVV